MLKQKKLGSKTQKESKKLRVGYRLPDGSGFFKATIPTKRSVQKDISRMQQVVVEEVPHGWMFHCPNCKNANLLRDFPPNGSIIFCKQCNKTFVCKECVPLDLPPKTKMLINIQDVYFVSLFGAFICKGKPGTELILEKDDKNNIIASGTGLEDILKSAGLKK